MKVGRDETVAKHLFEKRERFRFRGIVISIAAFLLLAFAFLLMFQQVEQKNDEQRNRLLEDAFSRALVSCYAIEGRYPPSVQYIVDNYGVYYDEEKYVISYFAFAENIMPSVRVLTKGA